MTLVCFRSHLVMSNIRHWNGFWVRVCSLVVGNDAMQTRLGALPCLYQWIGARSVFWECHPKSLKHLQRSSKLFGENLAIEQWMIEYHLPSVSVWIILSCGWKPLWVQVTFVCRIPNLHRFLFRVSNCNELLGDRTRSRQMWESQRTSRWVSRK